MGDLWAALGGAVSKVWQLMGDIDLLGTGISPLDIIYTLFGISLITIIVKIGFSKRGSE